MSRATAWSCLSHMFYSRSPRYFRATVATKRWRGDRELHQSPVRLSFVPGSTWVEASCCCGGVAEGGAMSTSIATEPLLLISLLCLFFRGADSTLSGAAGEIAGVALHSAYPGEARKPPHALGASPGADMISASTFRAETWRRSPAFRSFTHYEVGRHRLHTPQCSVLTQCFGTWPKAGHLKYTPLKTRSRCGAPDYSATIMAREHRMCTGHFCTRDNYYQPRGCDMCRGWLTETAFIRVMSSCSRGCFH